MQKYLFVLVQIAKEMTLNRPIVPNNISSLIPVREPTWGLQGTKGAQDSDRIKATWLGHACFLVELPARSATGALLLSRGPRILFDPIFSDRCSPTQWMGPKRFTRESILIR
jgi:N-acyl-phosphatidylethanolamine-hydrolysing phospholipase D